MNQKGKRFSRSQTISNPPAGGPSLALPHPNKLENVGMWCVVFKKKKASA